MAPSAKIIKGQSSSRAFSLEMSILAVLTIVGGSMRAYMIGSPRTPVYDESYMGVIVNKYRHGEHFFDIHPPFNRLLHYYISQLLFAPECEYSKDMKWTDCDMWQMRSVSLLLGTLLIPLSYLVCRLHGGSIIGGFIAAFFITFDNMMFSLSRIHLLDMTTLFCIACTLCAHAALIHKLRFRNEKNINILMDFTTFENVSTNYDIFLLIVLDGIAIGCAVSSKFGVAIPTAFWCVLCVIIHTAHQCYDQFEYGTTPQSSSSSSHRYLTILLNGLIILVFITTIAIFTYLVLLYWHFSLIPWKLVEEGSYTAYALTKKKLMKQSFSKIDSFAESLLLSIDFKKNSGGVLEKIIEFTLDQYYYYVLLDTYELEIPRLPNSHHSHGSMVGWLFSSRGLLHALFHKKQSHQTDCSGILFIPNVMLCWCVTLSIFGYLFHKCYSIMLSILPTDDDDDDDDKEDTPRTFNKNDKKQDNTKKPPVIIEKFSSLSVKGNNNKTSQIKHHNPHNPPKQFFQLTNDKNVIAYSDGLGSGCLLIGWFMHLLPFLSVHRELFIIYYVFAYYFGIIYLSLCCDKLFSHFNKEKNNVTSQSSPLSSQQPQKDIKKQKSSSLKENMTDENQKVVDNQTVKTSITVQENSNLTYMGPYLVSSFLLIVFITFVYIRPLNTGELESIAFLNRMAQVMPACWNGECFNSPQGTPFRSLVEQVGGDDRNIFPYLIMMEGL